MSRQVFIALVVVGLFMLFIYAATGGTGQLDANSPTSPPAQAAQQLRPAPPMPVDALPRAPCPELPPPAPPATATPAPPQKPCNPWFRSSDPRPSTFDDTTGPGVPNKIRELLKGVAEVDEDAVSHYGAAKAVAALEAQCVWNAAEKKLDNPEPITKVIGQLKVPKPRSTLREVSYEIDDTKLLEPGEKAWDEIDIVLPTIRDTRKFFEKWKPFIRGYHVILVQDGTPEEVAARPPIEIPDWVDYELYDRTSIIETLGAENHWIISTKDASIRNFGLLVSKKKFVLSIDDDCYPARDNQGHLVDAIWHHVNNLRTNSTPYMYNTIYDGFRPGADFVRGYPYSLRQGVPTGVSHGLWLNTPDYDAPTQLLKPRERNEVYADVTMTVPHGQLYPLCSMNVAFNRRLMGPSVMQGLMGTGQPWARYDDMFCGWASKTVGDHLRIGTKNGAPYIWHDKASNPFTNLAKEYKGLFWQEEVIKWFSDRALKGSSCANPADCYMELADQIRKELSYLHSDYFPKLAKAMEIWTKAWVDAEKGKLQVAKPKRQSKRQRDMAILCMVRNEPVFLKAWLKHYRPWFPDEDIWIIDNDSNDGSIAALTDGTKLNVHTYSCEGYFDHKCIVSKADEMVRYLMNSVGYRRVVVTEADELLFAKGGLRTYLCNVRLPFVRAEGHHVIQGPDEPPIDWSRSLVRQRKYAVLAPAFSKPIVVTTPDVRFTFGFHGVDWVRKIDPEFEKMPAARERPSAKMADEEILKSSAHAVTLLETDARLILYHIQMIDRKYYVDRKLAQNNRTDWNQRDVKAGLGYGAVKKNEAELHRALEEVFNMSAPMISVEPWAAGQHHLPC